MFIRATFRAHRCGTYGAYAMAGRGGIARGHRLVAMLGVGALGLGALAIPAGATPSSTSSTSTTVAPTTTTTLPSTTTTTTPPPPPPQPLEPPPPAFPMPMDSGIKLVADLQKAQTDIKTVGAQLPELRKERDRTQIGWNRLVARLAEAQDSIDAAERQLEASHKRLQAAAARAYMQGATARVNAVVGVLSANDVVQASGDLVLIDRYGAHEMQTAQDYAQEKAALEQRVSDMNAQRVDARSRLDAAQAALDDAQRSFDAAQVLEANAKAGIERFKKAAIDSGSPVLGPSFVSAEDLAAFVIARGYKPNINVPILELAKKYIMEGNVVGVRADVAWAQSILETDGFQFPGSGALVGKADNNFAGIGACDSCKHAFTFRTAGYGVRAQMQLLRTYVDPKFGPKTSKYPIMLPKSLKLGFRGKVQSWYDLGRHWATGANYGQHVYKIYWQIVAFAAARDRAKKAAGAVPHN